MTTMAALTASSEPLIVKLNFSKARSAPELVQMSDSIARMSVADGGREFACAGSGWMIHHVAL